MTGTGGEFKTQDQLHPRTVLGHSPDSSVYGLTRVSWCQEVHLGLSQHIRWTVLSAGCEGGSTGGQDGGVNRQVQWVQGRDGSMLQGAVWYRTKSSGSSQETALCQLTTL